MGYAFKDHDSQLTFDVASKGLFRTTVTDDFVILLCGPSYLHNWAQNNSKHVCTILVTLTSVSVKTTTNYT